MISGPSTVQDSLKHMVSYERFRTLEILSWNKSGPKSSWNFSMLMKICLDILSDTGLLCAKLINFPMEQHHTQKEGQRTTPFNHDSYRCIVGRLIYLTITRLDLAYSVQVLSQFIHQPRQDHWDTVLWVLTYIKSISGQVLFLQANSDLQLLTFYDFD